MIKTLNRVIEKTTMYRLTLYYVAALLALATLLGAVGLLKVSPVAVVATTAILLVAAIGSNALFASIFRVHSNPESSLITALILALIMGPVDPFKTPAQAGIVALAAVVAIASKYLIAPGKRHLFNPAAVGALFAALVFGDYASWWVGSVYLLPLVIAGGLALLKRIARLRIVGIFIAVFLALEIELALLAGLSLDMLWRSALIILGQSSLLFFAAVMFTEPMTSPKRFLPQIFYAAIVAFLYQPQLTYFGQNLTPEEALLIGNLFAWIVSPRYKFKLALKESRAIGDGIMSFAFNPPSGFTHLPGQYMEWTLPLERSDKGGDRRYFSIASAPSEGELVIAAKFGESPSRYKRAMASMSSGDTILAGELSGDFTLPRDESAPLVFIAGGIGITPFRSMIKHLVDSKSWRDIVLLYAASCEEEIVFRDVFEEAREAIGMRTVYSLTDDARTRATWRGRRGYFDAASIREEVPDFKERTFLVSGPPSMVDSIKAELRGLGVARTRIRTDYFPGY